MALGTNRTRNWGKEAQQAALSLAMQHRKVAYKVEHAKTGEVFLMLAASHNGLPSFATVASLHHACRERWEARNPFNDRALATGISERDVIRKTIQAVWQ